MSKVYYIPSADELEGWFSLNNLPNTSANEFIGKENGLFVVKNFFSSSVAGKYPLEFIDGDLDIDGILTVTHNLNSNYVPMVKVMDNNDNVINNPDNIFIMDSNTIKVDLSSFRTLIGTWKLTVIA